MKTTLIIFILTIQSSYVDEVEEPAEDVPDTLQWWISDSSVWRIKTFAKDHDIHIYQVSSDTTGAVELALETVKDSYDDVIASTHILEFQDFSDKKIVSEVFQREGLKPTIDTTPFGCTFWTPDSIEYRTKSNPK